MSIGTALGWGNPATIALSVVLAFLVGYSLTMLSLLRSGLALAVSVAPAFASDSLYGSSAKTFPLLRSGLALVAAVPLAFASDSISIAAMELADNAIILAIPGAMDAELSTSLFWGSLAFALGVAFCVAYPVNRYLIARGQGHAVVHAHRHAVDPTGNDVAADLGSPTSFVLIGFTAIAVTIAATVGTAVLLEG